VSERITRHWAQRIAREVGDSHRAVEFEGRGVDRRALAGAVVTLGERLAQAGLVAGDLVAVLAPPSLEGVALIHALLDRRYVLLPLNSRLRDRELDFILASSGARWLFASQIDARVEGLAARAGCGLVRFGAAHRPDGADLRRAEGRELDREGQGVVDVTVEIVRAPAERLEATHAQRRDRLRDDDAALVLYTSGTSGQPKGAVLSFTNLLASAAAQGELLGSDPTDRWLLCMPLFHVGGLSILIRSVLAGSSVVLQARFEAERVSEALDGEGITHVSFVATMLARLLEVRGERRVPEALRLVLLGGGPAAQSLLERARALGYPIAPTYGLTEAASQVATRPPDARPARTEDLASGLRALPGVEIRIVDSSGAAVGAGGVGEIEVRGPIVMVGYLEDRASSGRGLRDGWLATGDLGWLDAEGGLRVLDRRSDLIVSGGENVYPAEVESVLTAHPNVVEAGVVGGGDPDYGQRPVAFVVWEGIQPFDDESLSRWCGERLARFKQPVAFHPVEGLPRTPSGKLMRRRLASLLRAPGERSRGPGS
jgi:O-succinylbenzoic acid--CoA ligase